MARWVTDGSPYLIVNGDLVEHSPHPQEKTPSNAMWEDGTGVSSGRHYWRIHFSMLEGRSGFGFTSGEHFRRGYDCKAAMYMFGDLCHGGRDGTLVLNFGPKPVEGDTVGMLAVFEEDRLKVYFDVNGKSLGLAFSVPRSVFTSIYPMVRFYSVGSASCTKQTEIPDITVRPPVRFVGIEGNWKLRKFFENDVETKVVVSVSCKIEKKTPHQYEWSAAVSKTIRTKLTAVNGKWITTPIISDTSTLAQVGHKFEVHIKSLMNAVRRVEVGEDGHLSIESDTISTLWKRYDATPRPFMFNPFGGRD